MRAGVTIVDPAATWIDVGVTLAPDAEILPGTHLEGQHRDRAGPGSVPAACCGTPRWRTGRDGHVRGLRFGRDRPGASVGPFAPAPGHPDRAGAHIGSYVELKNATVGEGSKVPHLSYVGDADIGEQSNIGAATIFANYDGAAKHHSTVGDHVRIGSDTMLVAPVTIGDGAYTAAGSVITEDVPAGALGIARGQQHNSDGWVERRTPGRLRPRRPRAPDQDSREAARTSTAGPALPKTRGRKLSERDGAGRQEADARLRPGLPRAGRGGGRVPGHRADGDQALRLRERRDLRPLPGLRPRLRRVRAAEPHLADQRVDHGAADHGRRPQAGVGRRITVVAPFFGYARQDKKNRGREPISARLMADLFATAGADRLMAVDLHTAQIQGFFDGPVDHLFALSILATYIEKKLDVSQVTVVAPDAGRVRVCERWTDRLGCPLAIIHKRRDPTWRTRSGCSRWSGRWPGAPASWWTT
jgi:carbonic anhydrase/acetyltransferase-like protein (isoleucine patch superfamily)